MELDVNAVIASLVEWAEARLGIRASSTLDTPGAAQSIHGLNRWLIERNEPWFGAGTTSAAVASGDHPTFRVGEGDYIPDVEAAHELALVENEHRAAPAVLVFRDEPALKTVTSNGAHSYEIDEVREPDASYQCGMRLHHTSDFDGTVGWRERDYHGADHISHVWVPFYEVQLPGDPHPSRFCEDCMGWLIEAADHIRTS